MKHLYPRMMSAVLLPSKIVTSRNTLRIIALLSFFVPLSAHAAWQKNPEINDEVLLNGTVLYDTATVSDGSGGMITVATESDPVTFLYYVRFARVDADGNATTPSDGIRAIALGGTGGGEIHAVEDGNGGVFVVTQKFAQNLQFYAYHLDSTGSLLSDPDGVQTTEFDRSESEGSILADGQGGFFFASRFSSLTASGENIVVQRMDANLNQLWTVNGTPACIADAVQRNPTLASDGSGGAWIAWVDERNVVSNGVIGLYFNRITDARAVLFGASGQQLFEGPDPSSPPVLGPVPSGGFWLAASLDGGPNSSRINVRRIAADGGIPVSLSLTSELSGVRTVDPSLVVDPQGNVYVAYTTRPDGQGTDFTRVFVESLTLEGFDRWGAAGVEVQAVDSFREMPTLYLDSTTGVYCVYGDLRFGGSLYAQRFDFLGNRLWSDGGVAVATAPGAQSSPVILPTDGNSILVAFEDERSDDLEVYAQRVDLYGLTGDPAPTITSVADAPQDQGGVLLVDWDASDRDTLLDAAIADYLVWRRLAGSSKHELSSAAAALAHADAVDAAVVARYAKQGWEYVGSTPAIRGAGYSASVPSYGDSAPAPAPVTEIQVVARTGDGGLFTSAIDGGTSVDNLAPPPPQDVVAVRAGDAVVSWSALILSDLNEYVVYRGSTPDFVPDATSRLGATTIAQFIDESPLAGPSYYRVSAVDIHENEGPASDAAPLQSVTAADGPRRFSTRILSSSPNPFNPRTTVRFELESYGRARLTIHDVRGRRIATLVDSDLTAGEHSRIWEGVDDLGRSVASGTYLVLLRAGDDVETGKLTLVE